MTTGAVYYLEDLCRLFSKSRSTIKRLRACGAFPIAPLPIPGRPCWRAADVDRYLASDEGQRQLTRTPWNRRIA